jgi:hypothetical protein
MIDLGYQVRDEVADARRRAQRAARVLRGEDSAAQWRWLAAGLAAGVALGAAGAVALRRARQAEDLTPGKLVPAVREKAGSAVGTLRDGTATVAHRTADGARQTVARARDAVRGHDRNDGHTPPETAEGAHREEPARA